MANGIKPSLGIWIIFSVYLCVWSATGREVVIATLVEADNGRGSELFEVFRGELESLLGREFDLRFPEELQFRGDWSLEVADDHLDRALQADVDLVISLSSLVSSASARRGALQRPLIAVYAIDPAIQGFPRSGLASGVENFNYIGFIAPFERDLRQFAELTELERVAVLAHAPVLASLGTVAIHGMLSVLEIGLELEFVPVGDDVDAVLDAIPEDVDGVYLAPLLHFDLETFTRLAHGLVERGLPSFSMYGHEDVEAGILAGLRGSNFVPRLARRTALNAQRILLGENAGELPVDFQEQTQLMINMRSARAVGVYPAWDTLTGSELLHDDEQPGAVELTLESAVEMALVANRDLATAEARLRSARAAVRNADARWLPVVGADLTALWIDEDRASATFSTQPERELSGRLQVDQLLSSALARGDNKAQAHLLENAELQARVSRLDVIQEASTAYLNVLRANTLERIQRQNLRLSRSNLQLAETRRRLGAAATAETLRWQSRIASDRQAVVLAGQQGHVAEIELARVLDRPLGERFAMADVALDDQLFLQSDLRISPFLYDPRSFRLFVEFMAVETRRDSPELAALDAAVEASRAAEDASKRDLFEPRVGLRGSIERALESGGAGSTSGGSAFPGLEISLPDKTDWSLALSAGWSLFDPPRRASSETATARRLELEAERREIALRVEQRARTALNLIAADSSAIDLSGDAARTAHRSLELVTDAYAKGLVSITDLLEAQNSALIADQAAANAAYDYLVRLMEMQRAIGRNDFETTTSQRDAFFVRLEAYFATAGVPKRRGRKQ